jgi:hypothetical protein
MEGQTDRAGVIALAKNCGVRRLAVLLRAMEEPCNFVDRAQFMGIMVRVARD